ncbi:hypothetical protein AB0K14_30395 [Actinosynnema sp. NPDC050801]|uniref:hypothetical protein n=1 Tax=unclassified Actinosynnema TaxID=2637065 RepID=UPI0033FCC2C8
MPRLSRVFAANVAVTDNWAPVTTWTCTGSRQITSDWNHDRVPTDALLRGHEPVDESVVDLSIRRPRR